MKNRIFSEKAEMVRRLGEPTQYWQEDKTSTVDLDFKELLIYLYRATPRFSQSLYKNIRTVPPGYKMVKQKDGSHLKRIWTPLNCNDWKGVNEQEIAAHIKFKLRETILDYANGHKKIGLCLSGGLDSAILASLLKETNVEVICYTCEFPEFPETNETHFARIAADYFKLPISIVRITKEDFGSLLADLITTIDRPLTTWSSVSQLAIGLEALKDGCDIILSGVGSDELFTGYSLMGRKYKSFLDFSGDNLGSAWDTLLGSESAEQSEMLFLGNATPFPYELIQQLFTEVPPKSFFENDVLSFYRDGHAEFPDADIGALMSVWEMLQRTSEMLHSDYRNVEKLTGLPIVYPFYTQEMLSAFNNIPMGLRFKFAHEGLLRHFPMAYDGIDKYILRLAFENDLPVEIQTRTRMAFSAPFAWWLHDQDYAGPIKHKILNHPLLLSLGINKKVVEELFLQLNSPTLLNQWDRPLQVWMLYMLCEWFDKNKNFFQTIV
jgi:asparagine synthetase B (glutamine-hydrolysing)